MCNIMPITDVSQANSGDFDYIKNKRSHKIFSLFVGEKLRKI